MFNTSATLLHSKNHNPKHPTSIVVVAAALIPFRIVAIDDEKETTMRLAGEQPHHLIQLFIASSPFRTFPYRIVNRIIIRLLRQILPLVHQDGEAYAYLLNVLAPEHCSPGTLDTKDPAERANLVLKHAEKMDCKRYLAPKDIVEGSANLNLAFVAHTVQDSLVTPRRWIYYCNPALSKIITKWTGGEDWVLNTEKLAELRKFADNEDLQSEWKAAKRSNKINVVSFLKEKTGYFVSPDAMFANFLYFFLHL
ncbi:unnamed protein product [Lactuca virosa]|uniref:Calponin-homology (CH) domain-containing protein n=1 Tax=Lactuca virosa TaxID=75947 RepID=A0AAU9PW12_9ASTR|nr:unnamed protein product [Lactuca virosa]